VSNVQRNGIKRRREMKVSVIIPTYNGERTLERAITSVLTQEGLHHIEILLCDDRSDDLYWLLEIADKYNCKLLRNPHHTGGPNMGRKRGIAEALGDVITFLDQDDEWVSDKLNIQLNEINNGAEFVYSPSITCKE